MRDGAQQQLLQLSQELRGRWDAHTAGNAHSVILQQSHSAGKQYTMDSWQTRSTCCHEAAADLPSCAQLQLLKAYMHDSMTYCVRLLLRRRMSERHRGQQYLNGCRLVCT